MSHPTAGWRIQGGENFRSKEKAGTNPQQAMKEWLKLCDAITSSGGRILVMPPPAGSSLTGMIYTANSGALFRQGDSWQFLVSKMAVPHRQAERPVILKFLAEAGVPTAEAQHTWEGQAEITTLPGNRFIISYGVRSVKESLEEVRARLPSGARVLEVQLREPFFHGDTCLAALVNRGGDCVLLAHQGAMVNRTIPELRSFVGSYAEVISVDADDALGYACNSLCINGQVLMPTGLSTGLRGTLIHRGFTIEELELGELFGKGGGGPRCLINQLTGFVLNDEAPSYGVQRDKLYALAETYPSSVQETA